MEQRTAAAPTAKQPKSRSNEPYKIAQKRLCLHRALQLHQPQQHHLPESKFAHRAIRIQRKITLFFSMNRQCSRTHPARPHSPFRYKHLVDSDADATTTGRASERARTWIISTTNDINTSFAPLSFGLFALFANNKSK